MITDLNISNATSSRSTMARPLKRGRACMNCRFLKIKCDGLKPVCGPCRKHPKDDECEYSDGPARSRTKALEDTVQRLEARLHELEHPEDSTPSVTLYDPYPQFNPSPKLTESPSYQSTRSLPNTPFNQLPRLLSPVSNASPESQGFTPLSPFSSASSTATTPPFGKHSHGSSPLGIFDSRGPTATPEPLSILESDPNICDGFVQTFRSHSFEFGFFLDWQRFLLLARHSLSPGSMRSSSALLNAIYMWGAHLSSDDQRELHFKHKALQFVATELTPVSFLYTIQAEVLLSYYFFRTGHFLEARAHTATAVALALGGGLHQIRSLNHPDIPVIEITEENEQGVHLPAPRDSIEEGERINGFWAVFMLQKNLSVALEPASRVNGIFETSGMQIDTPWPLEMNEYKQGLLTSDIHGDSTVCNYLHRPGVSSYHDRSIIAMNVKACILLHRAVLLHGQWRPNFPEREAQSWGTAFNVVDQLIKSLRLQLPTLAQLEGRGSTRTILLTHSLLNAATIKLHSIFYSDPTSRQTCLDAARDMFRFGGTDPRGLGYLNPMMGTLWMTACSVFIDELRRIRATDPVSGSWEDTAVREKEMLGGLSDGLDALSSFARESLLMRHQLTKAQEAVGAMQ
ncbi:hypothetical protein C8F04DRAFT_1134562 [Mycena alexandri]|uniref:Zn(2)-C6 fungal-type domain-containing protein n=1 Tax=Mycena alexandri TaxID=1745969 RepID=A0AAD6S8U4_9AGAR|nr:hypothetical protein C8F04DRAFT_1134562 [Mycena alexandri]